MKYLAVLVLQPTHNKCSARCQINENAIDQVTHLFVGVPDHMHESSHSGVIVWPPLAPTFAGGVVTEIVCYLHRMGSSTLLLR